MSLTSVRRMGEELLLWRDEKKHLHCLADRCCHRGASLGAGKLIGSHVQCPFHGLEYDGDGRCVVIPASSRNTPVPGNYRVSSYRVHEAHGWIWIWWGEGEDAEGTPEYFPDIDDSFVASTFQDRWRAHYSRAVENQLDVAHLPFVHHNTIGRGGRTVVDGPGVEWVNDRMLYTYVFNRVDDGTPPRKPTEVPVPPPHTDFKLELIMPNLWQNHLSDSFRIVVAFVPVDQENTILYLRTYRRFLTFAPLRRVLGWLLAVFNRRIAHQDRRVVQTQWPRVSSLNSSEQLIQADLPILEYRRKRDSLLHES